MTFSDMFIQVSITLSERFESVNPFMLRKERFRDVLDILRKVIRYNELYKQSHNKNGESIYRVRAGDNWF